MKIKPAIWLLVFYALLISFNFYNGYRAKQYTPAIIGSSFLVAIGVYACIRYWPIVYFSKPPAEETKTENDAIYTQPILAWRIWNIEAGTLDSVCFSNNTWNPKTTGVAKCWQCTRNRVEFPNRNCQCGIYAKRDIHHWFLKCYEEDGPHVLGLVYLWGKIVEHDDGYRAQYAYPAKLFIFKEHEDQIHDIAAEYGIPCHKFSRWERFKFETEGTKWISESHKENLLSNLSSSLFQQNQSEPRIA